MKLKSGFRNFYIIWVENWLSLFYSSGACTGCMECWM